MHAEKYMLSIKLIASGDTKYIGLLPNIDTPERYLPERYLRKHQKIEFFYLH